MSELRTKVCTAIVGRLNAQQLKGKARDRAALELICGASIALGAMEQQDTLSGLAYLVSVRGAKELELSLLGVER